jgi:putative transcriptional regulator
MIRNQAPKPGTLLVASTTLLDPSFAESVVLVLEPDDTGALGVVLNRPTPVRVSGVLPQWVDLVCQPRVLHAGGPVGTEGALAVGWIKAGETPPDVREIVPRLGIVDLDGTPSAAGPSLLKLRIFAGYAGWSPGQLAAEIAEGSWHVVPATAADVFTTAHDELRRTVLRRQPGAMAWLANRPRDPELN